MSAFRKLVTCLFLGVFCLKFANSTSKSYPITTLINAKWQQTPLYLEIAEYLADENPALYWDFLRDITRLDTPLAQIDTESKQYITSMNVVKNLLGNSQISLLKLAVSMHSLTPRIQAHFQIAKEVLANGDCGRDNFVTVNNEIACTIDEMKSKLKISLSKNEEENISYGFDHVYPGSENATGKVVVFYGDIGSDDFRAFHKILEKQAMQGNIKYISRHYLRKSSGKKVRLSGYGVELHLKSTEYKSQDDSQKVVDEDIKVSEPAETEIEGFDFKALKEKFPHLAINLDRLRNNLLEKSEEIAPLKAWEFQELGLQAAQRVAEIHGEEALQILQFTAQNFPTQAKSLLPQSVTEELRQEVKHNTEVFGRTLNIAPPDGALFVNGLFFDADTLDLSSLMETFRSEVRVLETLYKNNIEGKIASSLLTLDLSSSSTKDFAIDIRDTAIMWVNDMENDAQYRRWPASVMDLLRPTFPGMLRNIRKNVFNLVLVIDPLHPDSRSLVKLAESFVIHLAPIRLGLVFDTRQETQETSADYLAMFCAYNYVSQKKDSRAALSFLTDVFASVKSNKQITQRDIRAQIRSTFDKLSVAELEEILSEDSDYDYGRTLSEEFVERLGFKETPQALLNGVPMQKSLLTPDEFEETILSEIIQQTTTLQKSVYRGDLTDSENVMDYLMNQPHVMPRLNQRILSSDDVKFLDLTGNPHKDLANIKALERLSNRDMTATLMDNLKYFTGKHSSEKIGQNDIHFLTLWVFADLDTQEGRDLLISALKYTKSTTSGRVAFIPNVEGGKISNKDNLNRLIWALSQTMPGPNGLEVALRWLKTPKGPFNDVPAPVKDIIYSTELHLKMLRVYSQRVININKSERMVIANGKMFGPLEKQEQFNIEDFGLVDRCNTHQYGDKIRKALQNHEEDFEISSDTLLKVLSTLLPRETKTRFNIPSDVKEDHSVVNLPPKEPTQLQFEIVAVLDPASRSAQKLASILILLRNTINCQMRVFMLPVPQHSDMPVKNFYRYVVEPEIQFLPNGKQSEGPIAKFSGLPANPLLTQNLQVPENWLVEVVRSVYDLDNVKLAEIGGPVHSEFELEYLLLEGHCFDSMTGAPPRGLQVTLGTKDNPTMVDTIVMANLGYFQLKANPGIWELRLRDGKSSEIYEISNAEGTNTIHANNKTRIMISSLRSHVIKLRVAKKPGMTNIDLLGDDEEGNKGIWNSITSSFSSASADSDTETLNIFSVASGHLYERLLRIMMVSLMKHTKSPVKFWFLKNYLSPQFTDFLPHMAKEYGFQYELVQYKWPRWLHQQTEKQRTIWGYKILFLDVLFPLNIRKIIFVDADAIVRADMNELNELDLNGAPYAYTPFCDSRTEMEGFRFWKQGYWRSHLMGRRYHISALYVVDLKRFRKIAAGDRLRGQYQALSQDPNSLSNLDQDLPNNMIHQVAIKSLPDEWLWCQTWCSDNSFKKAKVIDLCNNPQTKEAKLTAAQRIVPEWKTYDLEIKKLMAKVEDHENIEHDETSSSSSIHSDEHESAEESHPNKHSEL
ncbi:UDP-glucose:glycoprotein glucosyltransferase [Episyrphus balteatus]|uniref:UDP-glucose:glycoprotein glucosyltransferase n=1 Tax=Episyrphus balteatus TaxID=286459 RepID=UPI0024853009|nr:UDP-glucose:glycoprotein glucosyltransferase [Episyrphus balteatus]